MTFLFLLNQLESISWKPGSTILPFECPRLPPQSSGFIVVPYSVSSASSIFREQNDLPTHAARNHTINLNRCSVVTSSRVSSHSMDRSRASRKSCRLTHFHPRTTFCDNIAWCCLVFNFHVMRQTTPARLATTVPEAWCSHSNIEKKGLGKNGVSSFRPISILTVLSTVIERMVNRQLTNFLESHKLLPKIQSGFRSRHSTETAVLKVMPDILSAADRERVSILGLLDMFAAFDTLDHDILLHRMESSFGVGGPVLSWIRSFLQGRTQQVYSGGKASNVITVTSGVPQGRVLGPIFFILYTVHNRYTTHCKGVQPQRALLCRRRSAVFPRKGLIRGGELFCLYCRNREMDDFQPAEAESRQTQFIWMGTWQKLARQTQVQLVLVHPHWDANQPSITLESPSTASWHRRTIACFYQLRQLRVVRRSLSSDHSDACASLVHAFISSRLHGLLQQLACRHLRHSHLAATISVACRCKTRKYDPISEIIREQLHWLPVRKRIDFKLGVLVYKCLHNGAPPYLMEMVLPVSHIPGRRMLRSSAHEDVVVPRTESVRLGPQGFSSDGASLWNSLQTDLKVANKTFNVFNRLLKTHLFRKAYNITIDYIRSIYMNSGLRCTAPP